MRNTTLAAVLSAGAAVAVSGVAAAVGFKLNAPRRPWPDYGFTPFEVGLDAEDVRFDARDGVSIAAWWFDVPASSVAVICAHGHRGNRSDMLGIGPGLVRAGHSVLVLDFRGNGASGDGAQSLGHYEQLDLAAAIDWVAARRPDARIALVGFSMGAATSLMAAAGDERVCAVVADSPFAGLSEVVAANMRRYRLPFAPLLPAIDAFNRARYRYAYHQVRPVDAITQIAPRPILLLHGTDDRVIPYEQSVTLAEAAGANCTLVTFEGADHCGGYFTDRQGYIDRVDVFLRAAIA